MTDDTRFRQLGAAEFADEDNITCRKCYHPVSIVGDLRALKMVFCKNCGVISITGQRYEREEDRKKTGI